MSGETETGFARLLRKIFNFLRKGHPCTRCRGTGTDGMRPCPDCQGTGRT
jgi:DnaJ-class molecular chaperone